MVNDHLVSLVSGQHLRSIPIISSLGRLPEWPRGPRNKLRLAEFGLYQQSEVLVVRFKYFLYDLFIFILSIMNH